MGTLDCAGTAAWWFCQRSLVVAIFAMGLSSGCQSIGFFGKPADDPDVGDPSSHTPTDSPSGDELRPATDADAPTSCSGEHAYLHGDLWTMWYNFRVCCDAEHKALWRCERINGTGSVLCDEQQSHYDQCLDSPNSDVCPNWGVCCFKAANGCEDPDEEHRLVCTTSDWDYESESIWGTYYGYQWASSTDKHRFTTIQVKDAVTGDLIAAFSSNPGESDAYMDGIENHGVGPTPQGYVQVIQDKYGDRFGNFACIRLPADQPLKLQAFWLNDFAHTCADSYWSHDLAPCWTDEIEMTLLPGRHYLWAYAETGIQLMPGCAGPPAEVSKWLPEATCDTSTP